MRDEFQRRRDVFVAGLNKIKGFSCRMPKGAFYVFPNITKTGWKSKPLADALLEQAGVAALSGTAFGEFGEGYLRFSVANSLENLQQALDRLDQWTKKNLVKLASNPGSELHASSATGVNFDHGERETRHRPKPSRPQAPATAFPKAARVCCHGPGPSSA